MYTTQTVAIYKNKLTTISCPSCIKEVVGFKNIKGSSGTGTFLSLTISLKRNDFFISSVNQF